MLSVFKCLLILRTVKKMLLNFAMKNIIRNIAIANTNIYF